MEVTAQNEPLIPAHTKQATKAIFILLFFTFLMFTLPFAAFYGTKSLLQDYLDITGYTNTVWSVIAAVVTVNIIIVIYAIIAYYEQEYDEHGHPIPRDSDGKANLNLKED